MTIILDFQHYYLGTRYCGNWISYMMNSTQFDLRADGVEKEVFVDYGELYEDVRIRKGYSRKSLRHQKKVLAALPHNEAEYLRDILLNFDAKEVAESKEEVPSRHFGYWNISDRH